MTFISYIAHFTLQWINDNVKKIKLSLYHNIMLPVGGRCSITCRLPASERRQSQKGKTSGSVSETE